MAFSSERVQFKLDNNASKSIDEYLEYTRIVGDDDGGKLFTPKEYEAYKKRVIPNRIKNRLFVSWASKTTKIDCKLIGPETKCFCQHRYKQHKTDFEVLPDRRPIFIPCEASGCGCKEYSYVPLNGGRPIRCTCKHFADDHSVIGVKKCKKSTCDCKRFYSSFTCGCGVPAYNHETVVETKAERVARGRPVGYDTPYKAMGGLIGFSSLADGYMRLDSSGIGPPTKEFLNQPPGPYDHPFLKMHDNFHELAVSNPSNSGMTQEERDMAFFEKRYQERLKQEKVASRQRNNRKLKNELSIPKKTTKTDSSSRWT